jgi:chitin disaccharide deacetylase
LNALIITADDFGLARQVNEAVEFGHTKGILSAAGLMVSAPFAQDAVERALKLPSLGVGLHLALSDAAPTLPASKIPRLVDNRGRLRSDLAQLAVEIAVSKAARMEMRAEIEAQFIAFQSTGLTLDHVSVHQHFHLHPIIAAMVIDVGARFGASAVRVPREPARLLRFGRIRGKFVESLCSQLLAAQARRHDLASPEAVFGLRWSGAVTRDRLRFLLEKLPSGVWEIYMHPATSDVFPGHTLGYRHVDELAALLDASNAEALRSSGRRVGGYRDVLGLGPSETIRPSKQYRTLS